MTDLTKGLRDYKRVYRKRKDDAVKYVVGALSKEKGGLIEEKKLREKDKEARVAHFIVKTDKMREALETIKGKGREERLMDGIIFSAEWGDSKSQFIRLVIDELKRLKGTPLLPILIKNLGDLTLEKLKEKIIPNLSRMIQEFLDPDQASSLFYRMTQEITKLEKSLERNVEKKNEQIRNLKIVQKSIKHPDEKKKLDKTIKWLQELPSSVSSETLDILLNIMRTASDKVEKVARKKIKYVWCIDEIDTWWDLDENRLEERFLAKAPILRKLFEPEAADAYPPSLFVLCLTPRSWKAMRREKEVKSPVFDRIRSASKNWRYVEEPYGYGEKLSELFLKLVAQFSRIKKVEVKEEHLALLFNLIKKQTGRFESKRRVNSRVISVLNDYKDIVPYLDSGIEELEYASDHHRRAKDIGDYLHNKTPDILKELENVHYSPEKDEVWIHEETQQLDGRLEYDKQNFLLEIKSSVIYEDFERRKKELDKIIKASARKGLPALLLFFGKPEKEEIEGLLKERKQALDLDTEPTVHVMTLRDKVMYAPIIGAEMRNADREEVQAIATWIEDHSKFIDVLPEVEEGEKKGKRKIKEKQLSEIFAEKLGQDFWKEEENRFYHYREKKTFQKRMCRKEKIKRHYEELFNKSKVKGLIRETDKRVYWGKTMNNKFGIEFHKSGTHLDDEEKQEIINYFKEKLKEKSAVLA